MSPDVFFRWFPMIVATTQLVLLPLLLIALNSQIDARITRHNDNLYAHPALSDLKKLDLRIEELARAVAGLQLSIERITPRRRDDLEMRGS